MYSLELVFQSASVSGKLVAKNLEEPVVDAEIGSVTSVPLLSQGPRVHVSFLVQAGVTYSMKIQIPNLTDGLNLALDPLGGSVDGLVYTTYVHDFIPKQTGNNSVAMSFEDPSVTGRVSITNSKK